MEPTQEIGLLNMKVDGLSARQNDVETALWGIERDKVRGGLRGDVLRHEAEIERIDNSMKRPPGWVTMVVIGGVASLVLSLINLATILYLVVRLGGY